jgi:hypothetical protein
MKTMTQWGKESGAKQRADREYVCSNREKEEVVLKQVPVNLAKRLDRVRKIPTRPVQSLRAEKGTVAPLL